MRHAVFSLVCLVDYSCPVRVHPLYPVAKQPSWQAAVPVPIQMIHDVPNHGEWEEDPVTIQDMISSTKLVQTQLENTSFALSPDHLIAQSAGKEQFSIRLHAPSETLQQSLDGVKAVEDLWEKDRAQQVKEYEASKQILFDAIAMNMKRVVRESMAPLSSLRNPLT